MKFIIAARTYNPKSQGCVLLHKLASTLNNLGHKAAIIFFNGHGNETQWFISNERSYYNSDFIYYKLNTANEYQLFLNDAVVIYPEIITAHPLKSNYVVRYMLNREGFIKKGVPINPGESDFILTHSYLYHQNPNFHLFHYEGDANFCSEGTKPFNERDMDVTYIGKGAKYNECFIVKGSKEITREWPANKLELADMLRKTRYFYTWDAISATNMDAILCGSVPVFMQYTPISYDEAHNLLDIHAAIPKIKYQDTLTPLEDKIISETQNLLVEIEKKLKLSNSNWSFDVEIFVQKLKSHFKLK